MIARIGPSFISGSVQAPASKSSMQRACALALLHKGETIIKNAGISNDDKAAIEIIKQLGATVSQVADLEYHIKGRTEYPDNITINCGESGLSVRMFTPIAALTFQNITIEGEGSLLKRPLNFFDEILPKLGVSIRSNNGYLPLQVCGPLIACDITIDGSLSSQFLTGLLIAYGYGADFPATITVKNLSSKPYIDLTLQAMQKFGYKVENHNYEKFVVHPVTTDPSNKIFTVEGDWSGAAFLLIAGAISGSITVKGLDLRSTQADRAILQALMSAQIKLSISEEEITVNSSERSFKGKAFHFNAIDCPDLFPPLVALASVCEGKSIIEGVHRLLHKESDRASALVEEFGKMGVEITIQDDLMIIEGTDQLNGSEVHSHHDHRIVMACGVAGLIADKEMIIGDAEAINKSYPAFFDHLKMLGAAVSLT
jgi:3-phosphoshikimate 1-carboxyvinyltransferase